MLAAACTLAMTNVGLAQADSSNFAGPYVGLQALGLGAEFAGTGSSSAGDESAAETDKVQVGAVAATFGIEAGYTMPLGPSFALDVGAQYLNGEGKITATNSGVATSAGNVTFSFDEHVTAYIAPTLILSDTSSIYFKLGVSQADVFVEGDITSPDNLEGTMYSIGTRTVLDSGIFIRTEAGVTDYQGISARGKGEGTQGTTRIDTGTSFSADPTIVHGTVSLGFRF